MSGRKRLCDKLEVGNKLAQLELALTAEVLGICSSTLQAERASTP